MCATGYLFHKADLLFWLIISLILFFYTCNIVLFITAKLLMYFQLCMRDAVFFKPKSVDGIYLFEISVGEYPVNQLSPLWGRQITGRGANPCTNGCKKREPRRGDTQQVADCLSPLRGFVLSSTRAGAKAPACYLPVLRTFWNTLKRIITTWS